MKAADDVTHLKVIKRDEYITWSLYTAKRTHELQNKETILRMYLYNAVTENCRLVIQVQVDENIEADDKYLHRRDHLAPLRALDPLEVCFFLCCFFMFKKIYIFNANELRYLSCGEIIIIFFYIQNYFSFAYGVFILSPFWLTR